MDNLYRSFAPSLFRGEQWIEEPSYEAAVLSSKNSSQKSEFAPGNGDSQRARRKSVQQNEELPLISTSTLHSTGDTFNGSLQSLSSTSMLSSSGRATGSSDPYYSTGRSTLRLSFEEEPCLPHIRSEYGEVDPMGKSLRLLKSPHSRQWPTEHDVLESPLNPKGCRHSYPIEEDLDPYQSGEDRQARHSAPAHRRAISYDPEPAQGAHAYETGPPRTQPTGFDTASKARLRRSRLKSADAAVSKHDFNSSQDASSDADSTYVMSKSLQPKPPTGASRSNNGLDKFALALPHDERPVGGSSSSGARAMGAYSQHQEYPDQEEEYEAMAPSPARRQPSGGRRIRAHSDAPPAQASAMKLSSEVTSLIDKPDTTYDYIPSEDITPCMAPTQDMAKAYKGLETQEWPEIFHTLNTFRKLALHHPHILLSSGSLHNLILLVMKRVDALRSSLAKNALLTLEDLLNGLKKNLDSEVAAIVPGILKRAIDSSSFLVESADSVLQTTIEQTSLARSLGAVLLHVTHRSAVLRSKVAMCLYAMVIAKGDELPLCKEFDSFKSCLPKLLHDAAPDTRAYSRETVRLLLQRQLASRGELETPVGADLLDKILREASIAHALSPTVNGRVIAAPRNAGSDYGSFSPARPAKNGRHTPARDSAAAGPFTPTRERAHSDWSATEDGGTPTPSKNRAQRATQLRLQNPPNRIKANMHRQDQLENDDQHDFQHLAQSAEQLSAQLDTQLASPARPTPLSARGPAPTHSRPSKVTANTADGPPTKGGGGGIAAKSPSASQAASALAAAAKRAIDRDPELSCLQEVLASTAVSSWTERKTALNRVTEMIIHHYDVLKDANKLGACVDSLLARLEDGSVKVHMHTLECLERIYSEEPLVLQHNLLQIVVPAVLGSAASTNKLISGKSVVMLRLLFDTLSLQQVAQYLCQTALHEKDKLRLTALRFLTDVMPVFCCDHDSITCIAKKILFPMLCKLLFTATTKGDLRVNGVECARSLQSSLPAQKIWLWADDPHQQEELKRITNV